MSDKTRVLPVDLFPAEVMLPDGSVKNKARIRIDADGVAHVWAMRDGEPYLFFEGQTYLEDAREGRRLIARHQSGPVIVNQTGGCECGGAWKLRTIEGVPEFL